jgi:hypothetical protein
MRKPLLAGVFLLGVSCGAAVPPATRFLNFDAASDPDRLRSGWSSFERSPEGDTYAWAAGREARIVVQEAADRDLLLRFRCWPFWFPDAPAQTIGVAVNGLDVETLRLAPDRRVYTVYVPREAWRPGANEVAFAFAYAERPQDHGGGADDRTLAVAFDWLEIVPPLRPR